MLELQPFSLFLTIEEINLDLDMWEDGMPNPWALEKEEAEMSWRWRGEIENHNSI